MPSVRSNPLLTHLFDYFIVLTCCPCFFFALQYPYPCGILPCDRERDLREFYSTISDPALFENPASPQSLALDWITNHDSMMICPNDANTCHTIQRYVLAVFYFSTQGYQWTSCSAPRDYDCEEEISNANSNCDRVVTRHFSNERIGSLDANAWLTPAHECTWGGVACHGESASPDLAYCMDQIDFEANNLAGIIPDELGSLDEMRYLYLEDGSISSTIPSKIGNIENLEVLNLSKNMISGTIPDEIFGLTKLAQLELDNNELTGTLSAHVGNLGSLNLLQLENNLLEGEISGNVGNLVNLEEAYFSYNNFTGQVGPEICALRSAGTLEKLQVDCLTEVSCECCTSCS